METEFQLETTKLQSRDFKIGDKVLFLNAPRIAVTDCRDQYPVLMGEYTVREVLKDQGPNDYILLNELRNPHRINHHTHKEIGFNEFRFEKLIPEN